MSRRVIGNRGVIPGPLPALEDGRHSLCATRRLLRDGSAISRQGSCQERLVFAPQNDIWDTELGGHYTGSLATAVSRVRDWWH